MNQSSPYYAYGHPLHILQDEKETSKKECSRNDNIKLTCKLLRINFDVFNFIVKSLGCVNSILIYKCN